MPRVRFTVSKVMGKVQSSANLQAWEWRVANSPAGSPSPSLSLPIYNSKGGGLLPVTVVVCDSEKVAALFLFCSCEGPSEWFMTKVFYSHYPSLDLFLGICLFGYRFYWEPTSSITPANPWKKTDWMFHSILFSKEKLLFPLPSKEKRERERGFNH